MHRGPLIVFAAVVCLAGGLLALRFPVFIDAYDQFGLQVKCGSGFTTELTQASSAVGPAGTSYVDQCGSALMVRRLWAIPTAVLGGMALTWQAAAALAHDHRRPAPSQSAAQSPS
ncbi:hypothetical protein [Mycobacterium avium]|jgi:hypothetical protein|uniref:hypothetical protein n=1 Tax=Mycobacterium avium TaxID=1764 RepID=UPI00045AFFEB|nr:hypothetical protein [Mycobacterium avium]KBR65414.1 hypothetical protein X425_02068 [Mycobacterium avium XTB13-223]MCA4760606.1 hypothetical protein [Mycobacterium avium subsp. hominissuis]MDO2355294.1 hypothetical protein [Mycobacterium avium subsp. hominissuis]